MLPAHGGAEDHARKREIVDITCLPGQLGRPLLAGNGSAHDAGLQLGPPFPSILNCLSGLRQVFSGHYSTVLVDLDKLPPHRTFPPVTSLVGLCRRSTCAFPYRLAHTRSYLGCLAGNPGSGNAQEVRGKRAKGPTKRLLRTAVKANSRGILSRLCFPKVPVRLLTTDLC